MKKFQFRLQTVLNLREKEEEEAKKELVKSIKELEEVSCRITSYQEEQQKVSQEYNIKTSASELSDYFYYLTDLSKQIAKLEDELMRIQNRVNQKRTVVMEARKKVKTLHNLKNKQLQRWTEKNQTVEKKALDEVAMNRFTKEMKGNQNEQ
jgi:flagellar export protein FliJ